MILRVPICWVFACVRGINRWYQWKSLKRQNHDSHTLLACAQNKRADSHTLLPCSCKSANSYTLLAFDFPVLDSWNPSAKSGVPPITFYKNIHFSTESQTHIILFQPIPNTGPPGIYMYIYVYIYIYISIYIYIHIYIPVIHYISTPSNV